MKSGVVMGQAVCKVNSSIYVKNNDSKLGEKEKDDAVTC